MRNFICMGIIAAIAMAGTAGAASSAVQNEAQAASPDASKAAPLTLDTPLEGIAANPKGKAVLDRNMPQLMNGPAYDMVKSMSLRQLQPMSQGRLTQAMLDKMDAELKAINTAS